MEQICSHIQCTGCNACLSICSKNAISMQPDTLGFLYPIIDKDKCVGCGACIKICPNNRTPIMNSPKDSYVGYALNSDEQLSSTSGGLASVICRWCIRNGGVVYGCSAKNIFHIQHIRVVSEGQLEELKGSKYVQSDIGNMFLLCKQDLQNGKVVVFIGTPCQIAGLKSYLRKDYENLYTIDFVCHGVPSQSILNEEIKSKLSTTNNDSYNLSFRKKVRFKSSFQTKYGIFINQGNNTVCHEVYPDNYYITGFLSALFYRKSCYQCHYTTPSRVSDITLGDFGDHNKEFISLEGRNRLLSMMTINTERGESLKNIILSNVVLSHIEYSELIKTQGQLRHPMQKHKFYDKFENEFTNADYNLLIRKLLKDEVKRIKKNIFISSIRDIIYRLPFFYTLRNLLRNS